ncbi:hypothetical protein [Mesorhizobium sp. LSJC264A00]|uniref:hypothetical protein n=1 Tax=unclassified Mesorhizobium TaxID=325217 RepID=UPI0012EBBB78|nr:hypothetical protein [Mesorhizobium sp. LSJC264A00]
MRAAKSRYEINQLGAVQWESLHPHEVPEADAPMMLMQIVISLEQLPRWLAWCRKLRKEHAGKPGMDFLDIWSVPTEQASQRSRLQVLNMQYPSSLGLAGFDQYYREWLELIGQAPQPQPSLDADSNSGDGTDGGRNKSAGQHRQSPT